MRDRSNPDEFQLFGHFGRAELTADASIGGPNLFKIAINWKGGMTTTVFAGSTCSNSHRFHLLRLQLQPLHLVGQLLGSP